MSHPLTIDSMLRLILTSRVYDVAHDTPLEVAPRLSRQLGNTVLLKREDLQPVFSFKIRGAYNRIAHLSADERARGVITVSAGNHAQGVAYAARHLGLAATIVMPQTTPDIKVQAVRDMGADVVLSGDSFDDAKAECERLTRATGRVFIPPFDDLLVIAGQGTIATEMLRHKLGDIAAVFVPVGGGGLIAGIGAYIKALKPGIKVIGVEPVEADAMKRSLDAGHRVTLEQVGIFADGVAVREVGVHTFALAKDTVDEIVLVSNDEICAAIKDVFDDTRSILEPAGALAVAGAKAWAKQHGAQGKTLVAVASGANMNFDRLRFVAERAEVGEQREAVLAVTLPEEPGAYKKFIDLIGPRNITEFNYRYNDAGDAHVFVGVQVADRREATKFVSMLNKLGYPAIDLTDDELAKVHVRHLVGGRVSGMMHELIYRFEFPERPGALLKFLSHMSAGWNITLFHYRNHGADTGRVLVGMQVPPKEMKDFRAFLKGLGYRYWDESQSAAYRLFLG